MGKNIIIILLSLALGAALFNPDEDAHQDAAMDKIDSLVELSGFDVNELVSNRFGMLGEAALLGTKYVVSRKIITCDSYKLFSKTKLKTIDGQEITVGFGVYGFVIFVF